MQHEDAVPCEGPCSDTTDAGPREVTDRGASCAPWDRTVVNEPQLRWLPHVAASPWSTRSHWLHTEALADIALTIQWHQRPLQRQQQAVQPSNGIEGSQRAWSRCTLGEFMAQWPAFAAAGSHCVQRASLAMEQQEMRVPSDTTTPCCYVTIPYASDVVVTPMEPFVDTMHAVVGDAWMRDAQGRLPRLCHLFVGPQGAGSCIHSDGHGAHGVLLQLVGVKRVWLWPPNVVPSASVPMASAPRCVDLHPGHALRLPAHHPHATMVLSPKGCISVQWPLACDQCTDE